MNWRCENLGMISTVQFTSGASVLRWTDGQWYHGSTTVQVPAAGVPTARTMKEARKVGEAFLSGLDV